MKFFYFVFAFLCSITTCFAADATQEEAAPTEKKVLIAILARNKAHVLDKFLQCIQNLDYNKKLISIYINTNNNSDTTKEILEKWVQTSQNDYAQVIFDAHDETVLDDSTPHAWTQKRLKVLGKIRNKSLQKTKECGCDYYFVVDCDNFIKPYTLKELIAKDKPIIAPMLRAVPELNDPYSNFFGDITERGYCKWNSEYFRILNHTINGTFSMPVVHCTYLIKAECLDKLTYYEDGPDDYEFVIFSRSARKNNIDQYICNEKDFGVLIHFFDSPTLEEEQKRVQKILPTL